MDFAVKIFEVVAAVADHRLRECGQRFFRNFNGAGNEELVVRNHEANVQHSTFNVQRSMKSDSRARRGTNK